MPAKVAGYDTVINDATYFNEATLKLCPGLKHIVFLGTGAASFVDLAAAERLGIKVSTIGGYGDTTVAEHAMGLVFAAARHIAIMHGVVRGGGWRPMQGMELRGKTLGVVGLGGIGRELANCFAQDKYNLVIVALEPDLLDQTAAELRQQDETKGRPADRLDAMRRMADHASARGEAMRKFVDAAQPLYASLSDDQKRRLPMLMHRPGRERFGMMWPGMEPGMGRGDDRGPMERGHMGRGREDRGPDMRGPGPDRRGDMHRERFGSSDDFGSGRWNDRRL